ncbi:MAG: hypothetical protein WD512_12350 [Candidatus Paceibacterota bacterium]
MNNLPRLVNEIIGWYQWKAKIKNVNETFISRIKYFFYNNGIKFDILGIDNPVPLTPIETNHIGKNYGMFRDYTELLIKNKRDTDVAILPRNYFYSSGSNNQMGFLQKKNKYNWLLDNMP